MNMAIESKPIMESKSLIIFTVIFLSISTLLPVNSAPIPQDPLFIFNTTYALNNNLFPTDLARLFIPTIPTVSTANGDLFRWFMASQLRPPLFTRQAVYEDNNQTGSSGIIERPVGSTFYNNYRNDDMFGDYGGAGNDDIFSQFFTFLFGSPALNGPSNGAWYGQNSNGGNTNVNANGQGRNDGPNSGSNSNSNFGMSQQEWAQYLQLVQAMANDGEDSGGGGGGGFGDVGQLINMAMSVMGGI